MSVDQIRAALDTIDATPRDGFLDELEAQLVAAWTDGDELDVNDVPVDVGEGAPDPRHRRRRWLLMAAAAIVVLAVGLLAVAELQDPDSVQTDTVPPTPAPTTNRATTLPLPPVDSSPDTLAPPLSTPPPGEEIAVTPDVVEFGDGLLGLIDNMARADGRTYVIAGRYETEMDRFTPPDEAVLAAFDDVGRELWRTEVDGAPRGVVVLNHDVWVSRQGEAATLTHIDASDGRVLGDIRIPYMMDMITAFDSLWVLTIDPMANPNKLIRVDPDLSTTTVELPPPPRVTDEPSPLVIAAGAGGIWVPLRAGGVAVIDPDTLELTVIPVDDIGHEVRQVAVDGDAAFVASASQATSIVDGHVLATVSHLGGEIGYLGPMDGAFGVQLDNRQFLVLRANDPMFVEQRQIAIDPTSPASSGVGIATEIGGEAWGETGRNYNLRRFELLPAAAPGE
jgi:hypothetical protein